MADNRVCRIEQDRAWRFSTAFTNELLIKFLKLRVVYDADCAARVDCGNLILFLLSTVVFFRGGFRLEARPSHLVILHQTVVMLGALLYLPQSVSRQVVWRFYTGGRHGVIGDSEALGLRERDLGKRVEIALKHTD